MFNLNELRKYRENNRLEAKKATKGLPDSLWETYSAFANTQGGYILLGVDELPDKSLCAIGLSDPEKLASEFWSIANNHQKVSANILTDRHLQIVEVDGKRIIIIEIPRADRRDKPVYVNNNPITGSFRRNGEGDYHCAQEEVRGMLSDQADISQDARILEQLDLDAFDYETIRRYRIRLQNARPRHVWENLENVEFLYKVGCVGRGENGDLRPTAAGILMFGFEYEIVKEFPNYFLDYQEHDDESIRWTDRVISSSGEWSGNIFDFYYRVYNRIAQEVKTPFKLEGDTRIDDTPIHKSLREALANALIHANFYGRRGLVIHRRPNLISIANPGGMRVSVDDAVLGGMSDPRNATLVKLFNLINIGERAGSGLPSIYDAWKNQKWPEPVLEEQFGPDRTVLSLVLSPQNDSKVAIKDGDKNKVGVSHVKKQAILDFLSRHGTGKTSELSVLLSLTVSRTKVYLKELIAEDKVIAEGANRNRTYKLKA
jgi:predicted HTH transcriptional regulator